MAAAMRKDVLKLACTVRLLNLNANGMMSKRFLRVDPEEEIERLYLKDSFEKRRVSATSKSCAPIKDVGRAATTPPPTEFFASHNTVQDAKPPLGVDDSSVLETRPIPDHAARQDDYFYEQNSLYAVEVLHHYNIFTDLFNDSWMFTPDYGMLLKVAYSLHGTDDVINVFQGNKIEPKIGSECPLVGFSGNSEKLYSLLLLNLDGHLSETSAEYLHWSCVNMNGDDGVTSGITTEYLQPIPMRGTGFHRYVFLLIEHDGEIDRTLIPEVVPNDLSSRTFHFSQFYDKIASQGAVPVAIHFFQSEWDSSVKETYHNVLDMPEPAFQYEYPVSKHPQQIKFPHREPFQIYLDMYRDKKEIAEEVLKEHLSEISPYQSVESQQLAYPLARPTKPGLYKDMLPATWIQDNMKHKANKTYKYSYIYKND